MPAIRWLGRRPTLRPSLGSAPWSISTKGTLPRWGKRWRRSTVSRGALLEGLGCGTDINPWAAREVSLDDLTRKNFPLPTALEQRLDAAARDVHEGRGYSIIRGFDPSKNTDEENVAVFLAIANYIGEQRGFQDPQGSMLSMRRRCPFPLIWPSPLSLDPSLTSPVSSPPY